MKLTHYLPPPRTMRPRNDLVALKTSGRKSESGRFFTRIARIRKVRVKQGREVYTYLLVTSATAATRRSPTLRTWRDKIIRAGYGWVCTCRHNPQLHCQVSTTAAVDCSDTSSFDSARVNQVVLRTVGSGLPLTFTGAVGNNVALRGWLVLQLDCVVVETGLFIIESDVAVLVELPGLLAYYLTHRRGA